MNNKATQSNGDVKKTQRFPKPTKRPLFSFPPPESLEFLENFDSVIQGIRPLNGKQFKELPFNIRDLSHQLTDERSTRRIGYMNSAALLSAYARYFLPWNLFRLTHVLSGLTADVFADLSDGSVLLDVGSGPLTVPLALWLSRPELRSKKLIFYCVDLSQSALSLGEEIFLSAVAYTAAKTSANPAAAKILPQQEIEPWKIIRVRESFGAEIRQKADFVFCVNMCNELYLDSRAPLESQTKRIADILLNYGSEKARFFTAEPAIPRTSRFISLLRDEFLARKLSIESPCPHSECCPMPGNRGGKWCHFVLNTQTAPKKLLSLSDEAELPKDRAGISFVLASRTAQNQTAEKSTIPVQKGMLRLRIISDSIKLPNSYGRYACSALGLTLAAGYVRSLDSGTLLEIPLQKENSRDKKSGAVIVNV